MNRAVMCGDQAIERLFGRSRRVNHANTFGTETPIIGMVHLGPLPGAPTASKDIESIIDDALDDTRALERGGVDAIMVENLGDAPYYPDNVPKHVVAAMARVTATISDATDFPLGVNVLRNDAEAALAIAAAANGSFIRINVHTGARVTDQGIIEGQAHETVRRRERLAPSVGLFTDFGVKHSTSIAGESPTQEMFLELAERGRADAIIVSGSGTGRPTDTDWLETVVNWRDELDLQTPVLVGSGVDRRSIERILDIADGAIVGTALKENGETHAPVDEERVAEIVSLADAVR